VESRSTQLKSQFSAKTYFLLIIHFPWLNPQFLHTALLTLLGTERTRSTDTTRTAEGCRKHLSDRLLFFSNKVKD